jgi:hypothetical protein
VRLRKRPGGEEAAAARVRRDPALLVELLLSGAG